MKLNLLVLRCDNIELSKVFYEKLGLSFVKEKHGAGPEHYSSTIDGTVIELYPLFKGDNPGSSRLGFSVPNVEAVSAAIDIHSKHDLNGKPVFVVIDPDGRKVEISE